jgi:hypothetical protein
VTARFGLSNGATVMTIRVRGFKPFSFLTIDPIVNTVAPWEAEGLEAFLLSSVLIAD